MSEKTLEVIEQALGNYRAWIKQSSTMPDNNKKRMLELIDQAQSEVEEVLF